MRRTGLLLLAAAALIVLPQLDPALAQEAAGTPEAKPAPAVDRGAVLARVNGTPIYKVDFDSALTNFIRANGIGPDVAQQQKDEIEKVVLDGLIGTELLYQKAMSIPIEVPQSEVDEAIQQTRSGMGEEEFQTEMGRRKMATTDMELLVRQNLVVQKLIKEVVIDGIQVSEDEIKSYYEQNPEQMQVPASIEVSHILIRSRQEDPEDQKAAARKKIDEVKSKIEAGGDFAELARAYSEDGSAANGGALGAIKHGETVPEFDSAAFALEPGQVSPVVQTSFGFHIIKQTAKNDAGVMALEKVHDQLADYLKQQKSRNAIEQLVTDLRANAEVELL